MARNSPHERDGDGLNWVHMTDRESRRHPDYGLGGWLAVFQFFLFAGIVAGGVAISYLFGYAKYFQYSPYNLIFICISLQFIFLVLLTALFYTKFSSISTAVFLFALAALGIAGFVYREVAQFRGLVCLDKNSPLCSQYQADGPLLNGIFDASILAQLGIFVLAGIWGLFFAHSRRVGVTFQNRMRPNDPFTRQADEAPAPTTAPAAPLPVWTLESTLVETSMLFESERDDLVADLQARIIHLERLIRQERGGIVAEMVEPAEPCSEPAFVKRARQAPGQPRKAPPAVGAADDGGITGHVAPPDPDTPLTLPPHIVSSIETLGESSTVQAPPDEAVAPPAAPVELMEDGNLAFDRKHQGGAPGGENNRGAQATKARQGDDGAGDSGPARLRGVPSPAPAVASPQAQAPQRPGGAGIPAETARPTESSRKPIKLVSDNDADGSAAAAEPRGWAPSRPPAAGDPEETPKKQPPSAPKGRNQPRPGGPPPVEAGGAAATPSKTRESNPTASSKAPNPDAENPEKTSDRMMGPPPLRKDAPEPVTRPELRPPALPDNVQEHPRARQASRPVASSDREGSQPDPPAPEANGSSANASTPAPQVQPKTPAQPRQSSHDAAQPVPADGRQPGQAPDRKPYSPIRIRPRSRIQKEDLPPPLRKHVPPAESPEDPPRTSQEKRLQPAGAQGPASAKPVETSDKAHQVAEGEDDGGDRTVVFLVKDGVGQVNGPWDGTSAIDYKECPSCAEPIELRAKHCRHCNHTYFARQYETELKAYSRMMGSKAVPPATRTIQALRAQIVGVLTNVGEDLEIFQAAPGVYQLRNGKGRVLQSATDQNRPALEQMREEVITIKGLLYEIAECIDDGKVSASGLGEISSEQQIAEVELIRGVKVRDCRKMIQLLETVAR